ncbi:diaminopimelate decarboxylase [Brassicibacter mesophilus]|uniref:diaminopimelate decarboxylase n=1 Tax=Brassicibacter mesophilus TaxID=745119 RepID=UPI003D1D5FB0
MKLFGTSRVTDKGILEIGGCNSLDLAKKFGTPLYVIDEELVRNNCKIFKNSFVEKNIETEVIYASKAFLTIGMCRLINEEGLSLDVVSGGELYTAIKSGFPIQKVYMHGNNKTKSELTMAIKAGVGRIIIDNKQEIEIIEKICETLDKKVDVLLRVNPGIEAHTHEYIQTTKNDSKFGESIFSNNIYETINTLINSKTINLKGFHCHIGSQIFEEESFYLEVWVMLKFLNKVKNNCGYSSEELNLGGGFGIYYANGDTPIKLESFLNNMLKIIIEKSNELNLSVPKIMIEPGRSIVSNAGTTLYDIGATKTTFGQKNYIFVDGGMTDNPRPALYGAKYEATIANKVLENNKTLYTVAGKCCESGDMIVKDIMLPKAEAGDILAVFSTGAYNYSMASNYNRIPRPAVIFVKNGQSRLVVKRESYEDLIKNDVF